MLSLRSVDTLICKRFSWTVQQRKVYNLLGWDLLGTQNDCVVVVWDIIFLNDGNWTLSC